MLVESECVTSAEGASRRPEPIDSSDAVPFGRRRTDRLQVAALVVLGVALAVGAVRSMQAGWIPVGDEALIEMRVRDVPGHMPLLGVYSRFGWSHPGPLQFLLLAVPYRLLGQSSAALLVGALVALETRESIAGRVRDRVRAVKPSLSTAGICLGFGADEVCVVLDEKP